MAEVREPFRWRIVWNPYGSWRERLAHWVHRLATAIDGRPYLRASFDTDPPLTEAQHLRCLVQGRRAVERSLIDEVRHEAVERLMRRVHPELYAHGQEQ